MENTAKKKKRRLPNGAVVAFIVLFLMFAALRVTHVITHVGFSYRTRFDSSLYASGMYINDSTASDIRYMKRLRYLSLYDTHIRKADFLSDLPDLEWLTLNYDTMIPYGPALESVPSLRNSPDLERLMLFANVEDLDFIAENPALHSIGIGSDKSEIKDISGLGNKPELEWAYLWNVNCQDYSVLLDLPSLEFIYICGTPIPDDIKDKLTEKGVEIVNETVEEYNKRMAERGN